MAVLRPRGEGERYGQTSYPYRPDPVGQGGGRSTTGLARWRELVGALHDPCCYPHPARRVQCIETHISAVLLAGSHAYKLRKPVDLGFVNFSTRAVRHQDCREELRLNRRLAPQLYLGVVPVTGSRAAPRMGGSGPVLEWAVHMRRFPQGALLPCRLARGRLSGADVEALARRIADFHATVPALPADAPCASPAQLWARAADNYAVLARLAPGSAARIEALRARAAGEHHRLRPAFQARRRGGRIRDGHGDLHMGNIVWLDGAALPFDALEFDSALRACDVMDEIGFLTMDLERSGAAALARRVHDAYLEASGDYAGLAVLPWYQAYRALVRAKVGAIRAAQQGADEAKIVRTVEPYLDYAERALRPRRTFLAITHGLAGSGKTSYTNWLIEQGDVVRLRSDVERKRLLGLAADARTGSPPGGGAYTAALTRRTYARLRALAATVLAAGYPVVVDATFLRRAQRAALRRLAGAHAVPFVILSLAAPDRVLAARLRARAAAGRDASEADLDVLRAQRRSAEPLDVAEHARTVAVDSTRPYVLPPLLVRAGWC